MGIQVGCTFENSQAPACTIHFPDETVSQAVLPWKILDCIFTGISDDHQDPACKVEGDTTSVLFSNCQFSGNSSYGVEIEDGDHSSRGMYVLASCNFTDNTNKSGSFAAAGDFLLLGNTFTRSASLNLYQIATLDMRYCTFEDANTNRSMVDAEGCDAESIAIRDCVFDGIQCNWDDGGALRVSDAADITVSNCVFRGNSVGVSSSGGAADINVENSLRVENCLFTGNRAHYSAGALKLHLGENVPGKAVIAYSTFTNNGIADPAELDRGGGIYITNNIGDQHDSQVDILNTVIHGNDASEGPDICISKDSAITVNVKSSNLHFGDDAFYDADRITSSENMIDADPKFADPDGGNYRLSAGSPCINTGQATVPDAPNRDLDGKQRSVGIPDMGCYESGSGVAVPGPGIYADRTAYGFGDVPHGESRSMSFSIRNRAGAGELKIYQVLLSQTGFGDFEITDDQATGHTFTGYGEKNVTVSFTPKYQGDWVADLLVVSTDKETPVF